MSCDGVPAPCFLCLACASTVIFMMTRWPRNITRSMESLEEGEWLEGKVRNVERWVSGRESHRASQFLEVMG